MHNPQRGKLILKEVPTGKGEKKVVALLSKFAKKTSVEALTARVRNTPYALSTDIEAEKAVLFIDAFQKFGATAVFIPHASAEPQAEELTAVRKPPDFAFRSSPPAAEEPMSVQAIPAKNGMRRLTTILVIVLLLLSVGYLIWQLWPIVGDNIRELIAYLKQLF